MLNNLLKQYSATKILFEVEGKDSAQESVRILEQIEETLKNGEWKITSSSVENNTMAMLAFFEMSVRKIGGDLPSLFCYYYSSLVANDNSLPYNKRIDGNRYRAFVTFKNVEKWNMILSMAQAPFSGYNGNLTERSFFDILLSGKYSYSKESLGTIVLTEMQIFTMILFAFEGFLTGQLHHII